MNLDLPVMNPEAIPIGTSGFSVLFADDEVVYFANLEPFDNQPVDDGNAMLMRIGRFRALNGIRIKELMEVFGVSRSTVGPARKRFVEEGEA